MNLCNLLSSLQQLNWRTEMGYLEKSSAFAIIFLVLQAKKAYCSDCSVSPCSPQGPNISFPFWKVGQSQHCGYPGFKLSCTGNQSVLQLPSFGEVFVTSIYYEQNKLTIDVGPKTCIHDFFLRFNSSATPFSYYPYFFPPENTQYTYMNCSSNITSDDLYPVPCMSGTSSKWGLYVYIVPSAVLLNMLLEPCQPIGNISVPYLLTPTSVDHSSFIYRDWFTGSVLNLAWSLPGCDSCFNCGFKSNTSNETYCFDPPQEEDSFYPDNTGSNSGNNTKHLITDICIGSFFLVVVVTAAIISAYYLRKRGRKKEMESQTSVERFLEEYKSLRPARYSYADIKKITDHFKSKLGEGGYGSVFKGMLPSGLPVAVKVLKKSTGDGGGEFVNEVGTIGRIHHVNIVRLLGFCADGVRRALIYEFMPNESLEKFISLPGEGQNAVLSWSKLRDIAVGVARGMEYLHQGCSQRILHFDIKPHNILLDHNFSPKISDFGLAKLCSKEQSVVSISAARGTIGYIAPEVLSRNIGNVSYKSDVYSFGMLLLEMATGRNVNQNGMMEAPLLQSIYSSCLCEEGQGVSGTAGDEEDDAALIARKLKMVGLWCIQWHPVDRPCMKVVVQMLEGSSVQSLQMPPDPFASLGSDPQRELAGPPAVAPQCPNLEVITEEGEEGGGGGDAGRN